MSSAVGEMSLPRDSYYIVGITKSGHPIYRATGPIGWTGCPGPNSPAGTFEWNLSRDPKAVIVKPAPPAPNHEN